MEGVVTSTTGLEDSEFRRGNEFDNVPSENRVTSEHASNLVEWTQIHSMVRCGAPRIPELSERIVPIPWHCEGTLTNHKCNKLISANFKSHMLNQVRRKEDYSFLSAFQTDRLMGRFNRRVIPYMYTKMKL